jgi:coenzyme Q-binding protein COQ10
MSTYTERQYLPYAAPQLFDLVADVERYPEFLPWVIESRIRRRTDHMILVDMTIVSGPLCKRFTSTGVLHRPHWIDISIGDALFDRFEQRWSFQPSARGGTKINFCTDFKFRSHVLQMLMAASFADRTAATISAFKRRANWLYGESSDCN